MEGICWNIENDGLAPQSPDQPHRTNLYLLYIQRKAFCQLLKLKVDKNSTNICMFHEHYEIKLYFGGKKGQYFQICQVV